MSKASESVQSALIDVTDEMALVLDRLEALGILIRDTTAKLDRDTLPGLGDLLLTIHADLYKHYDTIQELRKSLKDGEA